MATKARQFFAASDGLPGLPGAGMPQDRMARLAARRVFVELKADFIAAVNGLEGAQGQWLRVQVRAAEEPVDLWLLRAAVMQALSQRDEATRSWRRKLKRSLEQIFPDSADAALNTGFGAFAQA